jgi:uncharacterized DUF497 family protein
MESEWDDAKDQANIRKHGISFAEAKHVFDGPVLTRIDDRADYGEVREISLGLLSPEAPLMVVHTARGEKIRLISARKASRREMVIYYDYLERTFETD